MRKHWVALMATLVALAACTVDQASAFDPEDDYLCTWFTDEYISEMMHDALGFGGESEEVLKSSMGMWGCWWQTSGGGLLLAPLQESDAHPIPEDVATYPHPALPDSIRVVDWPLGDWPPKLQVQPDGKNLEVVLKVEDRPQLLFFAVQIPSESEAGLDTALSLANEILNRMNWVD